MCPAVQNGNEIVDLGVEVEPQRRRAIAVPATIHQHHPVPIGQLPLVGERLLGAVEAAVDEHNRLTAAELDDVQIGLHCAPQPGRQSELCAASRHPACHAACRLAAPLSCIRWRRCVAHLPADHSMPVLVVGRTYLPRHGREAREAGPGRDHHRASGWPLVPVSCAGVGVSCAGVLSVAADAGVAADPQHPIPRRQPRRHKQPDGCRDNVCALLELVSGLVL